VIWWNNLERIMLAVHDLGCLELLERHRRQSHAAAFLASVC